MELTIRYGENIIVGTLFEGKWRWHVTEKEIWILDQDKLERDFIRKGYEINEQVEPERKNLIILDEKNVSIFLPRIEKFMVNYNMLQNMLREKLPLSNWNDVMEFFPSLFINFDKCELWSVFPEYTSFEKYVPKHWIGKYDDFYELIPKNEKYWIIDGHDHLKRLAG